MRLISDMALSLLFSRAKTKADIIFTGTMKPGTRILLQCGQNQSGPALFDWSRPSHELILSVP